ncbi:DEAD-box ATP-dependent RNA helicase 16 isoform X2 [Amborella trichopoda]|uniref:RNA helicase n=1 Tax=Amborella trichopoda TaxID=13333 RepID=U5D7V2_AMBTC|nr:DEAD-box ATP-dependent RNA helicase 16 isoform X2 [Amborella trichopoda]ERN18519.1 hypothetical protein AMTR_s00065p00048130 [Amborella trichopoda]|eukprot:XP_006857052.1 DEAD-box ATP-dependent RNA helicase 16 isoform X2 [Amborella trichopoda]
MATSPEKPRDMNQEEEEEEDLSFEELGLDARLVQALSKKRITKPTHIQRAAIPLILQGEDIVAMAQTGSGKTFAYLLPMIQKLFAETNSNKAAPSGFVLVPTRELCQQVYSEISSLFELCRLKKKVVQLSSSMPVPDLRAALAGPPDIVVTTPACISTCLSKDVLQASDLQCSLSTLVLDEADLLLSYGYEEDLKSLVFHVPRHCQCLLMSATLSADVEKLRKLVLHNPSILTLVSEDGETTDSIIPSSVQQFYISCDAHDKLLHILALLKLELVQKKVLIFVNAIDTGYKLKLFLEQFGIRSAVLNAELPQNSRDHILKEFNAGLFDYLIATDVGKYLKNEESPGKISAVKSKKHRKPLLDAEFGVARGIDFKNVYTVINFDMPRNSSGYVHRVGRTGRALNTGASVSLVSENEEEVFEEIKSMMGDNSYQAASKFIAPFPLLTENAVESLRYRAEDVAKSVTKIAIRESRAQDLRSEIINSEKLKAHFEDNPRDLELLKHDKVLTKKPISSHLRSVPDYLVDPTTHEASKIVKLSRAAMGQSDLGHKRRGKKIIRGKSRDPLKTFSAQIRKQGLAGKGEKRERKGADQQRQKMSRKAD